MKRFLSPLPILLPEGIALLRIVIGLLLIYHGIEIFDSKLMRSYVEGGMMTGSNALLMVYIGKFSELSSGVLMLVGLLTRVAALIMIATFSYITFFVGQGRFWYEDQHPFMFALFGLLYLFVGAGKWSIDRLIFK
jgi:putative oxidoreductase